MASSLLSLKPHKVSRDLSGYVTYIYGAKQLAPYLVTNRKKSWKNVKALKC